jgi:type I restriction enzyme S subunit
MKKYPKYKPSGVEWIGEIPENWDVASLKFLSKIQNGSTPSSSIDEYWDGNVNWVTTDDLGKLDSKYISKTRRTITEAGYQSCGTTIAPIGSVVISTRAPIGHIGILEIEACSNQGCKTVIPRGVDSSFCYYYMLNAKDVLESLGQGSTFKELPTSILKDFKIASPTLTEQTQIANYLDYKTKQIDTLIANKEKLIELLQEERTAIINQAVTKGINPNAKLKPSGIEWLGDIPENWEVWKLSHAFNKIGSGTTPESGNPIYHENGTINWLNTGDLNDGYLDSTSKKVTTKALEDYSALKLFPARSVVIAMYGATIGKTSIVNFETSMNQACCIFYGSSVIKNEFLFYWFKSKKENIINLAKGGGQPNISQDILKSLKVPCPKPEEQTLIINYIKEEETRINIIISKTEQEIELMKEYKTALISEVVTGKVDVREEIAH